MRWWSVSVVVLAIGLLVVCAAIAAVLLVAYRDMRHQDSSVFFDCPVHGRLKREGNLLTLSADMVDTQDLTSEEPKLLQFETEHCKLCFFSKMPAPPIPRVWKFFFGNSG